MGLLKKITDFFKTEEPVPSSTIRMEETQQEKVDFSNSESEVVNDETSRNSKEAVSQVVDPLEQKINILRLLTILHEELPKIDPLHLSLHSKLKVYRHLQNISDVAPDLLLSINDFITCVKQYDSKGILDDGEEIINKVLKIDSNIFENDETSRNSKEPVLYIGKEEDKHKRVLIIPQGITEIEGCKDFEAEEINLPQSLKSIGERAFDGCKGLTSIDIPNSVTSIGNEAFKDCTGLTSVTIGNSVTSIERRAFEGCTGLTSIDIPNSVTSIGDYAFSGCTGLTSIDIPDSVTSIGNFAFNDCHSLSEITLGSSLKSIGEFTFKECKIKTINISENVENIGEFAFFRCKKLREVYISSAKIKHIASTAFCCKIKTLTFKEGINEIPEINIRGVEDIYLPPSTTIVSDIEADQIFCFSPALEELEPLSCYQLFVLPEYLESYRLQAQAEDIEIDIQPMPDEKMYYYE